jgi:hypothetical protein
MFTTILPDGTAAFSKAGLAVGTTTTLSSANAIQYAIKGVGYSKAIATNDPTPTLDSNTGVAFLPVPVGSGCEFTICRDAAGTSLRAVQGQIVTLDASNLFVNRPQMAPIPDTLCPIGAVTVKVGTTGAAWTFGVSNFAGPPTGVVFSITDIAGGVPDRPVA